VQASAGSAAEHERAKHATFVEQSHQTGIVLLREFWLHRVVVPPDFYRGGRTREGSEDGVGRFSKFRRLSRLVSLSKETLLEKGNDGKHVSRLHDLRTVAAVVVFELACEARFFALEWTDGSEPTVYETNRRQRDLAQLLEQAQAAKAAAIPVLTDFTWVRCTTGSRVLSSFALWGACTLRTACGCRSVDHLPAPFVSRLIAT
jgi:hypothetical protein